MNKSLFEYLKDAEAVHSEYGTYPLTIGRNPHGFHDPMLKKYLGKWYLPISVIEFIAGKLNWYIGAEFFRHMGHYTIGRIKEDQSIHASVMKWSKFHGEKLKKAVAKIQQTNLREASNKQFAVLLAELFLHMEKLCGYGFIPVVSDLYYFNFSRTLEQMVDVYCKKGRCTGVPSEYVSVLTTPTYDTKNRQYKRALFECALVHGPKRKAKLENIIKRFYAIHYGHNGPGLTEKQVLKEISDIVKRGNIHKEYQLFIREPEATQKKQADFIKELHLSPQAQYLIRVARDFIYIKGYRLERLFEAYGALDTILDVVSKRTGLKRKELKYLSGAEFLAYLRGGKLPRYQELKKRMQRMTYTAIGSSGVEIRTGGAVEKYLKGFVAQTKDHKVRFSVHGTVACVGKVRGIVRIVNTPKDVAKLRKGDILISVQTAPELLPAMKKAAAFVTDIGGITSHAAIVSREMNKPCVIGTKIATKVFKDGDEVLVDALKGLVQKI